MEYEAHINVEVCANHRSIFYVRKYMSKETDTIAASLIEEGMTEQDQLDLFWKTRCVTSCEAAWEALRFPFDNCNPEAVLLDIHDEEGNKFFFTNDVTTDVEIEEILQRAAANSNSQLLQYFKRPLHQGVVRDEEINFDPLTFEEYFSKFKLAKITTEKAATYTGMLDRCSPQNKVILRSVDVVATIGNVNYNKNELYALLKLLEKYPAHSFAEMKDGHPSFVDRARALGLFGNDDFHAHSLMIDDMQSRYKSPAQIRWFLASLAQSPSFVSHVPPLFMKHWKLMVDPSFKCNNEAREMATALERILSILRHEGIFLEDADDLPVDFYNVLQSIPTYIGQRTTLTRTQKANEFFNTSASQLKELEEMHPLSEEQQTVFNNIIQRWEAGHRLFYINGSAGSGKTHLLKHLYRFFSLNKSLNVLCTAFTGTAASLLPGVPLTCHRAFGLPIDDSETTSKATTPTSSIKNSSIMAEVIKLADVTFIDEVSMLPKMMFDLIDQLTRELNPDNDAIPLASKTVILAGDFQQLAPVIRCKPEFTQAFALDAVCCNSLIWHHFETFTLTQPQRFVDCPEYVRFLDRVAQGHFPTSEIEVPAGINVVNEVPEPTAETVRRPISLIAPRHDPVITYNELSFHKFLQLNPDAEERSYEAHYNLPGSQEIRLTPADLEQCRINNHPPHHLRVAVGMVVMLIRNMLISERLTNGGLFVVVGISTNTIFVLRWEDRDDNDATPIPLFRLHFAMNVRGVKASRIQFPIVHGFAATVNKCQGKTIFDEIFIDLRYHCFAHGQLYVALSRVRHPSQITLILDGTSRKCTNVVYKRLLEMAGIARPEEAVHHHWPATVESVAGHRRAASHPREEPETHPKQRARKEAALLQQQEAQRNRLENAGIVEGRNQQRQVVRRRIYCVTCNISYRPSEKKCPECGAKPFSN